MANAETKAAMKPVEPAGDDEEMDGRDLIVSLRDDIFDGSVSNLALALGRPVGEIESWTEGREPIDSDALEKASMLAQARGWAND
jgi:hypothetical protein